MTNGSEYGAADAARRLAASPKPAVPARGGTPPEPPDEAADAARRLAASPKPAVPARGGTPPEPPDEAADPARRLAASPKPAVPARGGAPPEPPDEAAAAARRLAASPKPAVPARGGAPPEPPDEAADAARRLAASPKPAVPARGGTPPEPPDEAADAARRLAASPQPPGPTPGGPPPEPPDEAADAARRPAASPKPAVPARGGTVSPGGHPRTSDGAESPDEAANPVRRIAASPASLEGVAPGDGEAPGPVLLLEPRDGPPLLVASADDLSKAVDAMAKGEGPVAVDAERASGFRYGHRAFLVQLRRRGAGTMLIDPVPCPNLSGLDAAIADAEVVLHAASQDLPCLTELGFRPRALFDTELAGRLLGFPRVGL